MNNDISIFHAIAGLNPNSGGTSRVVVDLADALARTGSVRSVIVSQAIFGEPTVISACERVQRVMAYSKSANSIRLGLPFRSALNHVQFSPKLSLIHNHGLWLPVNYWAGRKARSEGIPMIIQPHGMLEPWAMNHKAWKKSLALWLFQKRDLALAKVLIATSLIESENFRTLGLKSPIAIIPNGVELLIPKTDIKNDHLPDSNTRTVLFLSRVHQKKGLLNLVRAWSQLKPLGWRLRIAGPNEGGHLAEVLSLAEQLGVLPFLEYVGAVEGAEKEALYRNADVFILPTFSENFGVVVAEALAHGLPVITTHGAPWADLKTYDCGWWIDIGVDPLVNALREALGLSDDERRAMGERGKEYVRRYNWEDIARQTIEVYRWILGKGDKPQCVLTD